MGEQLGPGLPRLRPAFLQLPSDPRVQLLAPALEQARVGRVLHQGVLEGVGRRRRRAPDEHQLGGDELLQGLAELALARAG